MSEVLEYKKDHSYLSFYDVVEFVGRDTQRIKKKINNGHEEDMRNSVIFEEVVFLTAGMCMQMSFESFKESYIRFTQDIFNSIEILRTSGDVLICRKIELIQPEKDCGITGAIFHFRLIFEKRIL